MRTLLPHRWRRSPNIDARRGNRSPDLVILHYTGMRSSAAAVDWLCNPVSKVSSHYVVDGRGRIDQLVEESDRAWHAGVSCWEGESDTNSRSIGIEIHNPGHEFGYVDFPAGQIDAVVALCLDIATRHDIASHHVLAHSDVAPGRKVDPGERFPWEKLHRAGVGLWVEPSQASVDPSSPVDVRRLLAGLAAYGYCVGAGETVDEISGKVCKAFQRHFLPARITGAPDAATIDTLERLLALRFGGREAAAAAVEERLGGASPSLA